MARTDDWTTMRFVKVEVQVTAAMVTALASLTTAEWVDLSSCFPGPIDQPQNPTRDVEETPVSGDASPIVSVGPNSARQFAFTLLYTEGEVLGTDNLDPYQDIFKPVMEDDEALVMPMRWTPQASGDVYTTSATGTYMIGLTDPVGGVTSEKIMFTATITTETLGIT